MCLLARSTIQRGTAIEKVISRLLWFCIANFAIGKNNSRHFLNQSEVKPKPMVTFSHAFSRACCRLHVFAASSDWFIGLSASVVIGQGNYFGFGFTTLLKTALNPLCNNLY